MSRSGFSTFQRIPEFFPTPEAVSYQTPWNPLEYGDVLWASEAQAQGFADAR